MKVVEENFRQLLQKVLWLWRKQNFVYIDEDFAKSWIRLNFLSLLVTGIIRIGVAEKGSLKKICGSGAYSSKAVHKIILRIYRAYAEST